MLLYTNKKEKVYCVKTKKPRFNGVLAYSWDFLERKINDTKVEFFFTVKNNRSYFYFSFKDSWYKTNFITKEDLDLYNYFEYNEGLYT